MEKKKCVNHDANSSTKTHIIILISKGYGSLVEFFFFFSTPKLGDYFVSQVSEVFLFSCFVLFLFFCLFFLQNVPFPHHISRIRLIFFFFQKFHLPWILNGASLSLFYYTNDGGHYVIDNFEFPCNSVKFSAISIWNFTNTVMKNVKWYENFKSVEAVPHSSDLYGDHGDI